MITTTSTQATPLEENENEKHIRFLMKITGISRNEIEEMLRIYNVPTSSIIKYIQNGKVPVKAAGIHNPAHVITVPGVRF